MKWTYSIKQKMTAAGLLIFVMAMVLLNNLTERQHSVEISQTMNSIYKDRLVVEGYIFQYSDYLHQMEEVIDSRHFSQEEKQKRVASIISQIKAINLDYAKTHLTKEEEVSFKRFNLLCESMASNAISGEWSESKQHAEEAWTVLKSLSSIQLTEAQSLMANAKKIFSSGHLSSQFEMAVLIIIALIIQALIFASKSLHKNTPPQQSTLN